MKKQYLKPAFFALFGLVVAFSIAKGSYTPEQQYKDLETDLNAKLTIAFEAQASMIEFLEKREAEKGNYEKALEYKKMLENRTNWKVSFQ